MRHIIWIVVLAVFITLNMAFYVDDPTRWWNVTGALFCSVALGGHTVWALVDES
jgi:hypothetical protein